MSSPAPFWTSENAEDASDLLVKSALYNVSYGLHVTSVLLIALVVATFMVGVASVVAWRRAKDEVQTLKPLAMEEIESFNRRLREKKRRQHQRRNY